MVFGWIGFRFKKCLDLSTIWNMPSLQVVICVFLTAVVCSMLMLLLVWHKAHIICTKSNTNGSVDEELHFVTLVYLKDS